MWCCIVLHLCCLCGSACVCCMCVCLCVACCMCVWTRRQLACCSSGAIHRGFLFILLFGACVHFYVLLLPCLSGCQKPTMDFFLYCSPPMFFLSSGAGVHCLSSTDQPVSPLYMLFSPPRQRLGCRCVGTSTQGLHGCWGPNVGPHGDRASTLPAGHLPGCWGPNVGPHGDRASTLPARTPSWPHLLF